MNLSTTTVPVLLDVAEIDALPTVLLPSIGTGVSHRVLWTDGTSVGGLMRIRSGGHIDEHAHEHASHDIWVVEGVCETLGRRLHVGSYVHIPAGVDHAVTAGDGGCTLLYFYRRS